MVNVPNKLNTVLRYFNGGLFDLIYSTYLGLKLILVLIKVSYNLTLQLIMSRFFILSVFLKVLVKPLFDILIALSRTSSLYQIIIHLRDSKVVWPIFS